MIIRKKKRKRKQEKIVREGEREIVLEKSRTNAIRLLLYHFFPPNETPPCTLQGEHERGIEGRRNFGRRCRFERFRVAIRATGLLFTGIRTLFSFFFGPSFGFPFLSRSVALSARWKRVDFIRNYIESLEQVLSLIKRPPYQSSPTEWLSEERRKVGKMEEARFVIISTSFFFFTLLVTVATLFSISILFLIHLAQLFYRTTQDRDSTRTPVHTFY